MDIAETKLARPGEEIDTERLLSFLGQKLGNSAAEIEVEQFPAGSSNLTYLIRLGHFEYVLRRPPFGNTVKSAHDMHIFHAPANFTASPATLLCIP